MTGWEIGSLGIVQETEIWPCYQMVYAQPSISPVERGPIKFPGDF